MTQEPILDNFREILRRHQQQQQAGGDTRDRSDVEHRGKELRGLVDESSLMAA